MTSPFTPILLVAAAAVASGSAPPPASAGPPAASAASPAASSAPPPPAPCIERVPEGKERPRFTETFPEKALSGYAVFLEVTVQHGKGEKVLPSGFAVQHGTDAEKQIERSHFFLPSEEAAVRTELATNDKTDPISTKVRIPFVPLPEKPGRTVLVLPPMPITVARASGDVVTVCTRPHPLLVEDPIANEPSPMPRKNPPPRPQLEIWTAARNATYAALIALAVGALVAWLVGRWLRRPKPAPPPTPPRPPWEVALEELARVRSEKLVESGKLDEHFDRVSNAVRRYLGDRYGYDGLESTTREALSVLRRVVPPIVVFADVERFLLHADLVKFARQTPTEAECVGSLDDGEQIIQRTIPPIVVQTSVDEPEDDASSDDEGEPERPSKRGGARDEEGRP